MQILCISLVKIVNRLAEYFQFLDPEPDRALQLRHGVARARGSESRCEDSNGGHRLEC